MLLWPVPLWPVPPWLTGLMLQMQTVGTYADLKAMEAAATSGSGLHIAVTAASGRETSTVLERGTQSDPRLPRVMQGKEMQAFQRRQGWDDGVEEGAVPHGAPTLAHLLQDLTSPPMWGRCALNAACPGQTGRATSGQSWKRAFAAFSTPHNPE